MSRPDIYRIMPMLQKLGLAEKIITSPIRFKATPIRNAVSILLERRAQETSELETETRRLIQHFTRYNKKTIAQKGTPQFVFVPAKEALASRGTKMFEASQTSVDFVCSWKKFFMLLYTHGELFEKAMKRGVKIRMITEKPEDKNSLSEIAQAFKNSSLPKIRHTSDATRVNLVLHDKKEMLISTTCVAEGLGRCPALWSNNPYLAELAQNYFETLWIKSSENQHEEH